MQVEMEIREQPQLVALEQIPMTSKFLLSFRTKAIALIRLDTMSLRVAARGSLEKISRP